MQRFYHKAATTLRKKGFRNIKGRFHNSKAKSVPGFFSSHSFIIVTPCASRQHKKIECFTEERTCNKP